MAQFISRVDDVQNPGIGQQQIVSEKHIPRSAYINNMIEGLMPAVDKAAQRYSQNKGEQIVQSAQQDLDTAIGTIQQHNEFKKQNPFIARQEPNLPESVKMSQDQFNILRMAVDSGEMTRDRARLHASKLVRQRISEQPIYSDQIRQSASSFLGFDPMSTQTRQFFAAFPTESSDNRNSYAQKRWEQAEAIGAATGADPDFIMKRMMQGELAEVNKTWASNQYELGQMQGREWLDHQNRQDTKLMYNRVFQGVMQARKDGALQDAEDFNRILEQDKQQHLAEVAAGYGGNTTDPEFREYRKQVDERYNDVQEYMTNIGVDNINQESLERLETMQELESRANFHDFYVLREAAGDAGFNTLLDLLGRAKNPEHLETMMDQFPALRGAYDRLNRDSGELQSLMFDAGRAIITGGDMSNIPEPVVDATAQQMHENGDEEQKTSVIQSLVANGFEAKPISILSNQSPRFASPENRDWFEHSYEKELPNLLDSIASVVANSSPDATFDVDEYGRVEVIPGEGKVQGPMFRELDQDMGMVSRAQEFTERVNLFGDAIENRWDQQLDTSRQDHANMVRNTIEQGIRQRRANQLESSRNRLMGFVDQRDFSMARSEYQKAKERFPDQFRSSFEDLLRAAGVEPGNGD